MQNKNQIAVCAAILAVSNMGQPMPSADAVSRLKKSGTESLETAVYDLAQNYMESDEHEAIFVDEAKGFAKDLRKMSITTFGQTYKDVALLYDNA